jgi:hypothetical protein
MAKKAGGPSKSKTIRDYKEANPDAGPKAIAEALGKQGTKVTAGFVSTVLSNARRKARKGRRGRPRGGRPAVARRASFDQLVQAKELVVTMGGVDKARQALDALAKLLD